MISDREFIDAWFDHKVSNELADLVPELKLLWQSDQDLSLMELLQQYPNLYPTVPLELYRLAPHRYSRWLTVAHIDRRKHLRSLLTSQLEKDLSTLETSANLNSTTYRRTKIRGSLHEFLASSKVEEESRRRAADPIFTRWSIEKNSLVGLVMTGNVTLRRTYDLSKVIKFSVGAVGALAAYAFMEEFIAPELETERDSSPAMSTLPDLVQ